MGRILCVLFSRTVQFNDCNNTDIVVGMNVLIKTVNFSAINTLFQKNFTPLVVHTITFLILNWFDDIWQNHTEEQLQWDVYVNIHSGKLEQIEAKMTQVENELKPLTTLFT